MALPVMEFQDQGYDIKKGFCILRLGAQSVTLLSTLRDPMQLRQRHCATTHQHSFLMAHQEGVDGKYS